VYRFEGREKLLSFGQYPAVSLKMARERRDEAKEQLAKGIDPGEMKKEMKKVSATNAANSFEVVAREWHTKQKTRKNPNKKSNWTERHAEQVIARLEKNVFPIIGKYPIGSIKPADVLNVLQRIEARQTYELAHRIMQICGQVCRYAVATGRAERNVVLDLKGALTPHKPEHHATITAPQEIGGLLRAIDDYKGDFITACALKMAPLTFVRPGELRGAEWAEFDLEQAEWRIPAERMKMDDPHIVPLARQTLAILHDLKKVTGGGKYLFPSARTDERPCDDVIAKYEQIGNGFFWGTYVEAMGRKAELIDDAAVKIRLYDAILDTSSGKGPSLNRGLAYPFLEEPRYLFPKYMMKKAILQSDSAEKVRVYDQIIESYGFSNASAAVEAYNAKIDLADDPSEKIALCDQLIAFINNSKGDSKSSYSPGIAKALRQKGEIAGDMSPLQEYYAEAIAGAAKEIEKERLTLFEICDIGDSNEKIAVCNQLIEKYRDSSKHEELSLLSLAFTIKAEVEEVTDATAASMTYDENIRVFTSKKPPASVYDDRYTIFNAIAKAYDGKVKLAASLDEKIRLYDESIAVCGRYDWITGKSINRILEDKVKVLRERQRVAP
jgi:integrase